MAAKRKEGEIRSIFICYTAILPTVIELSDTAERLDLSLVKRVEDFISLLIKSGVPKSKITTSDQASLDEQKNKPLWLENEIMKADLIFCVITPHFHEVATKGIDEVGRHTTISATAPNSSHQSLVNKQVKYGLPGHILRNLINYSGVIFVPIFLGGENDTKSIPLMLRGKRCFVLPYPFNVERVEDSNNLDLRDLFAQITGQRISTPLKLTDDIHHEESLSNSLYHDSRNIIELANKNSIFLRLASKMALPWDGLAAQLGLSIQDIATLKYNFPTDVREQCYQMLLKWEQDHATITTISRLTRAISKCPEQLHLLNILFDLLNKN